MTSLTEPVTKAHRWLTMIEDCPLSSVPLEELGETLIPAGSVLGAAKQQGGPGFESQLWSFQFACSHVFQVGFPSQSKDMQIR